MSAFVLTPEYFQSLPFKTVKPRYIDTLRSMGKGAFIPLKAYPAGCECVPSEAGCSQIFRYTYADVSVSVNDTVIEVNAKYGNKYGTGLYTGEHTLLTAITRAVEIALKNLQ